MEADGGDEDKISDLKVEEILIDNDLRYLVSQLSR